LPTLPLEDALQLVHLYGERGSPKMSQPLDGGSFDTSADTPSLRDGANVTRSMAARAESDD
jgi:hypothetical protein